MNTILRCIIGILLSVFCFVSCGSDYTLDVFGTISGRVTDSASGEPLPFAQVTLVPGANTVQTTSDGVFSFSGLKEGKYTVSAQKNGYQSNRKNDVKVVSGETTEIVITLTLIPNN